MELKGTALHIYLFVLEADAPVGTRDIMRGANISSSGLTYDHLQRLERLGILSRNERGDYYVKKKVDVSGFYWIGKRLIPRMLLYSFIFCFVLIIEIAVLAIYFSVEGYEFRVITFYLVLITVGAMALFMAEGYFALKNLRKRRNAKTSY
jgi:hypothetical protein